MVRRASQGRDGSIAGSRSANPPLAERPRCPARLLHRGRSSLSHMPEPTGLRDGPLIVVGCARSGTTMLQLMLDRHPRIAIPSETRFLMGLYRKRGEFGDLRDDRSLRDALRFIARPEALLSEWPTSRKDVAKAVQRAPRTVGSVAGAVFAAYAAETGKTRWG